MTLYHVRPAEPWERNRVGRADFTHYVVCRVGCVDQADCEAVIAKRRVKSQTRSKLLVLEPPSAPHAPRGTCRWCGDPIVREDGKPDRRRNFHYGPSTPRPRAGEPDCLWEWEHSRTWDARVAVLKLAGDYPVCAECGRNCEQQPVCGWEADHRQPLEDGGEHELENLQLLCDDCHHEKTARENSARAAKRRA